MTCLTPCNFCHERAGYARLVSGNAGEVMIPAQKGSPRIGILLLGHGRFASGLLSAVEEIVGKVPYLTGLDLDLSCKESKDTLEQWIRESNPGEGVLILVDLFGGSPSNLSISLLEPDRVEVLCGANLPMVLRALELRDRCTLTELAEEVLKTGKEQIIRPSRLLATSRT